MITITCKAQANCLLANLLCKEPERSEATTAVHESEVWYWSSFQNLRGMNIDDPAQAGWIPASFCTSPMASYLLEQKMKHRGCRWYFSPVNADTMAHLQGPGVPQQGTGFHVSRLIAMVLAALCAFGVEFTLAEGWDRQ